MPCFVKDCTASAHSLRYYLSKTAYSDTSRRVLEGSCLRHYPELAAKHQTEAVVCRCSFCKRMRITNCCPWLSDLLELGHNSYVNLLASHFGASCKLYDPNGPCNMWKIINHCILPPGDEDQDIWKQFMLRGNHKHLSMPLIREVIKEVVTAFDLRLLRVQVGLYFFLSKEH